MMGMLVGFVLLLLGVAVQGDIYMHNPRGSNGRGAADNQGNNRNNDERTRLFDSQNNDAGGYSAGVAYPFACYQHRRDDSESITEEVAQGRRDSCNQQNVGLSDEQGKAAVDQDGRVTVMNRGAGDPSYKGHTFTPRMYYYDGSIMPIEFTAQHGAGMNSKVHSDILIQVGCEDEPGAFSFSDDCGEQGSGRTCLPRDGTAISNTDDINLKKIPLEPAQQDNYRYGRHESLRWYQRCQNLERNKGLWVADQRLNGKLSATSTRQNPNGNNQRYGTECPEERDYFPYWGPTPWIDLAIITSNITKCNLDREESQNVLSKSYCDCSTQACQGEGNLPITQGACEAKGGEWKLHPAWNQRYPDLSAPECIAGAFSRDNHLGNVAGDGYAAAFNWTIPASLAGKKRCTIRIRYNMSSSDVEETPVIADHRLNGKVNSPILDRDINRDGVFKTLDNLCEGDGFCRLGLAINSDQYGRTFEDRSHSFEIRSRPADGPSCAKIHNLNVRGKRGNIVQVYPSVEYDFVPNKIELTEDDCLHIQWTGSDYNPNRNPNDAEGGPPNANRIGQSRSDRSNMVQMASERDNRPILDASLFTAFKLDTPAYERLAFLDQPVEDLSKCMGLEELARYNLNNNDAQDRDHRNCMKLSGQETPYFDMGLVKANQGMHKVMSTRNNNFSNRGQKALLIVHAGAPPAEEEGPSGGAIAGAVIGSLLAVGLIIAGFLFYPKLQKKYNSRGQSQLPTYTPSGGGSHGSSFRPSISGPVASKPSTLGSDPKSLHAGASQATNLAPIKQPLSPQKIYVKALFDRTGAEAGELTFKQGDEIEVIKKDPSGWWEGRLTKNGIVGVFPSNWVNLADSAAGNQNMRSV